MSSRHSRPAPVSPAVGWVLAIVILGTGTVAAMSESALALRLAIGGAIAGLALIWATYDGVLRGARVELSREQAARARAEGELARAGAAASVPVLTLPAEHGEPAPGHRDDVPDLWETSEAPTVVALAQRRSKHARAAASPSSAASASSSAPSAPGGRAAHPQ